MSTRPDTSGFSLFRRSRGTKQHNASEVRQNRGSGAEGAVFIDGVGF
jgi:hypothetical protein